MKTRTLSFLISVFFASYLMLLGTYSMAQNIVIGGYDYPPFMNAQSKQGIYHEVMSAINQETKLSFQWKYYPYARLNKLFEQGLVHIEVGAAEEWTSASAEPGIYTDNFYSVDDIALFRPREAFSIKKHDDIKGKTIGVVRGYGFKDFDDMFITERATRFDAKDEKQLLHMLYNGRLDAIFINKNVFLYHQMNQPIYQKLTQGDVIGSYKVGIRVHPSYKHIIPALNQAIKNLKRNNTIQRMAESFKP